MGLFWDPFDVLNLDDLSIGCKCYGLTASQARCKTDISAADVQTAIDLLIMLQVAGIGPDSTLLRQNLHLLAQHVLCESHRLNGAIFIVEEWVSYINLFQMSADGNSGGHSPATAEELGYSLQHTLQMAEHDADTRNSPVQPVSPLPTSRPPVRQAPRSTTPATRPPPRRPLNPPIASTTALPAPVESFATLPSTSLNSSYPPTTHSPPRRPLNQPGTPTTASPAPVRHFATLPSTPLVSTPPSITSGSIRISIPPSATSSSPSRPRTPQTPSRSHPRDSPLPPLPPSSSPSMLSLSPYVEPEPLPSTPTRLVGSCPICFEDLGAEEGGGICWCRAQCRHIFHNSCIEVWLRNSKTCPCW